MKLGIVLRAGCRGPLPLLRLAHFYESNFHRRLIFLIGKCNRKIPFARSVVLGVRTCAGDVKRPGAAGGRRALAETMAP